MVFDPIVFIEKLCVLVPPLRQNLVTYFGVFAPNTAFRDEVVVTTRFISIGVMVCPNGQGIRKQIAMITETPAIRAILFCLKLPVDPPVLAGPRGGSRVVY